ncbi:hypothetical protein [Paenibacillus borealis]|nr:hypothetical protein [Paenibacillus borealis]
MAAAIFQDTTTKGNSKEDSPGAMVRLVGRTWMDCMITSEQMASTNG